MRIPSGKTDQVIYFVGVDSADRVSRKTGLSSFTVYRSRNGGTATLYTTPTITELSSANMPGVYSLLIDEDTAIASGSDSEEYVVHISATGMVPVTRSIELYRDVLLKTDGIESGFTMQGVMRGMAAALMGKINGGGSGTENIRDLGDTKNRLVVSADSSGNRTGVTRDLT